MTKNDVEIRLPESYNKQELAKIIAKSIWKRLMEENQNAEAHCNLCAGQ